MPLQHIAKQNNGNVWAINFSFAEPLDEGTLDGSSLLTQFVDWSAATHDTLYVVAGNEVDEMNSVPTDNYNGVTVALSRTASDGVFRRVASAIDMTRMRKALALQSI